MIDRFNIRVYGILLHAGKLLVSDELIRERHITKFPGGGLEFGEGPLECLVREVEEELGEVAFMVQHFYTTDFFQASAFKRSDQIISIYFKFQVADPTLIEVDIPNHHRPNGAGEVFRWMDLTQSGPDDMTLPIDQHVLALLRAELGP